MQRITIDPITRLEGHGKIEIFLDEAGNVANAYLQVPELRGFEQFCVGRLAEEMPIITNRICGVCPEAHHLASVKALDALFGVEPTAAARKIRELLYMTFFVTDHTTHFYALGGPDFIVGPDAPPAERNILGVARKVGLEVAGEVIGCRSRNHQIIKTMTGRGIHPVAGLPGGWSRRISAEERREIGAAARKNVEFALFTLKIFDDIVLKNPVYLELGYLRYLPAQDLLHGDGGQRQPGEFLRRHDPRGGSGRGRTGQIPFLRLHEPDRGTGRAVDLSQVPIS